MPKLLVLFQSRSPDVVRLAEAATQGARSVRFAEVDLRRLPTSGDVHDTALDAGMRAHQLLQHVEDIGQYDGLILAVGGEGDPGEALVRTLATFGGSLANKVGAVITPATGADRRAALWSVLSPMADRGMILVPAPFADPGAADEESTRALGRRVAEVIGWVTHARSHHHHEHHHHEDHHHEHHHHDAV
jgi:hypothetical protein